VARARARNGPHHKGSMTSYTAQITRAWPRYMTTAALRAKAMRRATSVAVDTGLA